MVDLAPMSDRVPDDVKSLVEDKKQAIVNGEIDVFCGPLVAANGVEVLAEGQCMTDEQMLNMDFFLEGVRGEAPGEGQPLEGQAAPEEPDAGPVERDRRATDQGHDEKPNAGGYDDPVP